MTSPINQTPEHQPPEAGECAGGAFLLPDPSAREIDHGTLGPQWVLDELRKASK